MAKNNKESFEKWRRKAPEYTQYLIGLVVDRILPVILANGFEWASDYALCSKKEIRTSTIPLQKRQGEQWPTIELHFAPNAKPFFHICFGELPSKCFYYDGTIIDRSSATLNYAPARFMLAKDGRKSGNTEFGFSWFSIFPKRRIEKEVALAIKLLPIVFSSLEKGIPKNWINHKYGYVADNVWLYGSWFLSGHPSSSLE